jgi:hypothetical protein
LSHVVMNIQFRHINATRRSATRWFKASGKKKKARIE